MAPEPVVEVIDPELLQKWKHKAKFWENQMRVYKKPGLPQFTGKSFDMKAKIEQV